jgi:hypothetical protein
MEQKKRISIISIVVILIILILGGAFFTFSYINNPKVILSNLINKTFNEFSDMLLKSNVIGTQPTSINGDVTLKTNLDLTSVNGTKIENNDLTLKWKSQLDPSKKTELLNTTIDFNKENLFNFEIITKDDKGYIYVKDLLEDYYMFTITKQEQDLVVDKTLIKSLNKLFEASLKNENFVSTKEDITLVSDTISTNKHVLTIDEKNIERVAKSGAEYIKNDNYLLEKLATNSNTTKEEIIKSLDEFIKSEASYVGADKIQIYFNTNMFGKIYKFGININDQINIYSCQNKEYSEIGIDALGTNIFKMDGTFYKSRYNVNLDLNYDGINIMGNISSENIKNGLIKLQFLQNKVEFAKIDGTYVYESSNGITKFNLDLRPSINQVNIGNVNLSLNNEIKLENVDIKIPTNIVDMENMTPEQAEKFNSVISSLTSIMGINNTIYDTPIELETNDLNIEK